MLLSISGSCAFRLLLMKFFFKGDNVWDTIKKYKQKIAARRDSDESLITDITDGAEYVKLYQGGGFLSCPNNISFIVNTGKCA